MQSSAVIEVSGLDVAYQSAKVLAGVNLSIATGEAVALLGANGSGKSTLMRATLGMAPITAGDVRLFGESNQRTATVAWDRIGYVPQRTPTATGLPATALEVVCTGLLQRRRLWLPRSARQSAMDALDHLGLADRANSPMHELSGGQQQRVSIARALVRRPDLLVLDEPMAGVDAPTQRSFARALTAFHDHGATVLVVLHELGELRGLLDRAVVLRHGTVVHDGAVLQAAGHHGAADHDHLHSDHGNDSDESTLQRSLP